jgi:putative transposase
LLWSTVREFPVTVFADCITSNHTHVLASSDSAEAISQWMQRVEGEFAQSYNRRKRRRGAFWSDRYHGTMIEGGLHLWTGMVYIELNMVRARTKSDPVKTAYKPLWSPLQIPNAAVPEELAQVRPEWDAHRRPRSHLVR